MFRYALYIFSIHERTTTLFHKDKIFYSMHGFELAIALVMLIRKAYYTPLLEYVGARTSCYVNYLLSDKYERHPNDAIN